MLFTCLQKHKHETISSSSSLGNCQRNSVHLQVFYAFILTPFWCTNDSIMFYTLLFWVVSLYIYAFDKRNKKLHKAKLSTIHT